MGVRIVVALIVGTVMFAVDCYDGIVSIIAGQIVTVVAIAISVILGAIFLVNPVRRLWNSNRVCPLIILSVSVLLWLFGVYVGLGEETIHPELRLPNVMLPHEIRVGSFLAMIFAIVHWPGKHRDF